MKIYYYYNNRLLTCYWRIHGNEWCIVQYLC